MKRYFERADGDPVTRRDYTLLCLRFACETFGSPVFGPFNDNVLEFPYSGTVTEHRRRVLIQTGYKEIETPPEAERDTRIPVELID